MDSDLKNHRSRSIVAPPLMYRSPRDRGPERLAGSDRALREALYELAQLEPRQFVTTQVPALAKVLQLAGILAQLHDTAMVEASQRLFDTGPASAGSIWCFPSRSVPWRELRVELKGGLATEFTVALYNAAAAALQATVVQSRRLDEQDVVTSMFRLTAFAQQVLRGLAARLSVYNPVTAGEVLLMDGAAPACFDAEALEVLIAACHAQLAELNILRRGGEKEGVEEAGKPPSALFVEYQYAHAWYQHVHVLNAEATHVCRLSVVDGQLERLAAVKDHLSLALAALELGNALVLQDNTDTLGRDAAYWIAHEELAASVKSLNKKVPLALVNNELDPLYLVREELARAIDDFVRLLPERSLLRKPTDVHSTRIFSLLQSRLDEGELHTLALDPSDPNSAWKSEELPQQVIKYTRLASKALAPSDTASLLFQSATDVGLRLQLCSRRRHPPEEPPTQPALPSDLDPHRALLLEFKHYDLLQRGLAKLAHDLEILRKARSPDVDACALHYEKASEALDIFVHTLMVVFFRIPLHESASKSTSAFSPLASLAAACAQSDWEAVQRILQESNLVPQTQDIPPDLLTTVQVMAERLRSLLRHPPAKPMTE